MDMAEDWTVWALIGGIIFFLLLLSCFFSGSETALTASSRPRMHQLAKNWQYACEDCP